MALCSACSGSCYLWAKHLPDVCPLCEGLGTLAATFGFCPDDVAFVKRRCKVAAVSDGHRPVVLVATGTYGPPHRGHFAMLKVAEEALTGECVVGAIMVPSSSEFTSRSQFLNQKDQWTGLPYKTRRSLVLTMAEDLGMADWLHVSDAQEVRQQHYFQVLEGIAEGLAGNGVNPALVMVHGGDRHANRPEPPLWKPPLVDAAASLGNADVPGPNCAGIVVVPRSGPLPQYLQVPRAEWPAPAASALRAVARALSEGEDDLSSTGLRREVSACLPDTAAAAEAAGRWMTGASARMYVEAMMKMQVNMADVS